jgi:hypothetical protein
MSSYAWMILYSSFLIISIDNLAKKTIIIQIFTTSSIKRNFANWMIPFIIEIGGAFWDSAIIQN